MLEKSPTSTEIKTLLGATAFKAWTEIVAYIETHYNANQLWDIGRKAGVYELKFRQGGKTLCALYAREKSFGFMVIYGKAERDIFESRRNDFSAGVGEYYDEATTYHDGKWIMIDVTDDSILPDIPPLLEIKRKPKR